MFRWIILAIFFYLVYKYANYLIELFNSKKEPNKFSKDQSSRVNVEHDPKDKEKRYDEGEYIDFEEVKE